jgi:hypothetical protein
MTHPKSPTQTRAQIAQSLAEFLETAKGAPHLVRTGISVADGALVQRGYLDDHRWLCEHYAHVRLDDPAGVVSLAHRLIERLTIEGETAFADITSRTVDSLTVDVRAHLAESGDRRSVVARLAQLDGRQLAALLANALVRLSGYDAVIDELFRLRAKFEIEEAKADQAAAEAVQA